MNNNKVMNKAKADKNDEFYTQLKDIEKELTHYIHHFENKVIYMNADHPDYSKFWEYFKVNFDNFKLKRIVSTFYGKNSFKTTYDGITEERTKLTGNGDFRSDECVAILKKSDVIVTNPPFSLFRDLIDLIIDNGNKFVVLGTNNAAGYKDIFTRIRNNELWLGNGSNIYMFFDVPNDYEMINGKVNEDGRRLIRVPALSWFTNLEYEARYEDVQLIATYTGSEQEYAKYDNYDAINVDRVANIPKDYYGVMGVPLTFLGKWNPHQFEIVGLSESEGRGLSGGLWDDESGVPQPIVNGKRKYSRVFIKRRE